MQIIPHWVLIIALIINYRKLLVSEALEEDRSFQTSHSLQNNRPLAKILLIKFWDGLEAHPTRKKIFVGWASSPS